MASQLRSTSPAVCASVSPNTCGWRRISLARQCSATSASEPAPRSSSSSARKWTWKRTSPSSSSSFASSPACAAAASSYASSTVCGTIERSSCSRSQGHSRRRRRVSSSRAATAAATFGLAPLVIGLRPAARSPAGPVRLLLGLRRRLLPRARRRRRRRLGCVLAVLSHVALAALRLRLPLLAEVLDELVQRLLLILRGEHLLDRRLGLLERLLRRGVDLVDLEDVPAELGLDRTGDLALVGAEDRRVERLLLLALGDGGQLAALRLGRVVDGVLLGDGLELLPVLERRLGLLGLLLGLSQDDAQVAPLRLRELVLVLLVVLLDLLIGDLVLALGHLVADLVGERVEPHAHHHVLVGLARGLEELLVVGLLRERLLLLLVERLLDLLVGHLDALLLGLALDPLERDQQPQHLVAQLVVLLLALLLEVRVRLLRLTLRGLRRGLLRLRDAFSERGRLRDGRAGLTAGLRGDVEPVLEVGLFDRRALDLGHRVAGDPSVPATHEDGGRHKKGAERHDLQISLHDRDRG